MEHTVTNKDIIINLSIQLIQIILFFWVFVRFFGKKIAERVIQRQIREKKLAQADVEYQKIIDDAKSNADQIIKDATQTKNNLTTQGQLAAEQAKIKLIEQAHHEAGLIRQKTEQELLIQQRLLESEFEHAVKKTALAAVEKVISIDDASQKAYVQGLVTEFISSQDNHANSS